MGELKKDVLVIQFSNSIALEMSRKKDDLIRPVLKDILQRDVTVQYELVKASQSQSGAPAAAPVSPGTRVNRQQQDEVMSDPAVQMVMKGLSARPVQIDRIEEAVEHHDSEENT
jgi:hypothetical protein